MDIFNITRSQCLQNGIDDLIAIPQMMVEGYPHAVFQREAIKQSVESVVDFHFPSPQTM